MMAEGLAVPLSALTGAQQRVSKDLTYNPPKGIEVPTSTLALAHRKGELIWS